MTVFDIQREIASLPSLRVQAGEERTPDSTTSPLSVVARQGRVLLRLSAAVEAMENRTREMNLQRDADRQERESIIGRMAAVEDEAWRIRQEGQERFRACAMEIIHLMDSLEWATVALTAQQHPLAPDVASARKAGIQRLASIGITEVPSVGVADGRLHEGVDTIETGEVPPYHIVSVVRSGWLWGEQVLRRASVITAVPVSTEGSANPAQTDTEKANEFDKRRKEREPTIGKRNSRKRTATPASEPDHRD